MQTISREQLARELHAPEHPILLDVLAPNDFRECDEDGKDDWKRAGLPGEQ